MTPFKKCKKCNGSGYLACYKHIDGGRCFACYGYKGEHEAALAAHSFKSAAEHEAELAAVVAGRTPEENAATDALVALLLGAA